MPVRNGYEDVDNVTDVDGVVAVISRRLHNGALSVAFMKEFDRDGTVERTAFLQRRHLDAIARLVPIVRERMDALDDQQRAKARTAARK